VRGVFETLLMITIEMETKMPKKKSIEEQVKQGLLELAFGSVSDAVSLLYLSDEQVLEKLPKLKLFNVSEIKRPKGGGMEIKFFDRIKACERLMNQTEAKADEGMSFYQALEKSAKEISGGLND
jgi:hypothetical protein